MWPNQAVYPDYFNPNTTDWYVRSLESLHTNVDFDGLWLDMNEASDFCGGTCFKS